MFTSKPNMFVRLDGEAVDFECVEYKMNKQGLPTPSLDIVLTLKCGNKIYDNGSRVEIIHNNIGT